MRCLLRSSPPPSSPEPPASPHLQGPGPPSSPPLMLENAAKWLGARHASLANASAQSPGLTTLTNTTRDKWCIEAVVVVVEGKQKGRSPQKILCYNSMPQRNGRRIGPSGSPRARTAAMVARRQAVLRRPRYRPCPVRSCAPRRRWQPRAGVPGRGWPASGPGVAPLTQPWRSSAPNLATKHAELLRPPPCGTAVGGSFAPLGRPQGPSAVCGCTVVVS